MPPDNLTKIAVVLALANAGEQVTAALAEFTNPDNLLDLPDDLLEQFRKTVREAVTLQEMSAAYMEALAS